MVSFQEYLEDYEAGEIEKIRKFVKLIEEGKVSRDERYPQRERFFKLKEPLGLASGLNIWGLVPFYGSTIINLLPREDKKVFDEVHGQFGFTSKDIDDMIDFIKDTGRLQFIVQFPTAYKNLEFLEPLFHELNPPVMYKFNLESFIGYETYRKYIIEFDTLSQFGFTRYIYSDRFKKGIENRPYLKKIWEDYAFYYVAMKSLGYEELADEIGSLMITNPHKAEHMFNILGTLIVSPQYNTLKPNYNFNRGSLVEARELVKYYGVEVQENIPYEIGKFLLNKIVFYPETFDGCMKVIQEYDDCELYKVLGALDQGAKRNDISIIEDKKVDASEILDNVWKDADKIKMGSEGISFGVSLDIGLIGELAAGLPGIGLMAGLGFQAVDRFWGVKNESLSEKIAKFVSPNYLVTIYDFKKKHALTD